MAKELAKKKRWFEEYIRSGLFEVKSSALPLSDDALPPNTRRMPVPFPADGWAGKLRDFATGAKASKVFPSAEEKQVRADKQELDQALQDGEEIERSANLSRTLSLQLASKFKGVPPRGGTKPPAAAVRLQRAHVSLEALMASGNGFSTPADRKVLLMAMDNLLPEQRVDLLRADEATGRRLYSALYTAAKEDPTTAETFRQVKASAQLARVGSKLDNADPSGETSAIVGGITRFLDQSGVPPKEQQEFIDKLNFKLTIKGSQDKHCDLPFPDTSKPGWREKFAARTLSIMAETSGVSDESIKKAIPTGDLSKVAGHALIGPIDESAANNPDMVRREGDMRLARVLREKAGEEGDANLVACLDGLESNAFDRRLFLKLAQEGKDSATILSELKKEATAFAKGIAKQSGEKMAARKKDLTSKVKEIETELQQVQKKVDEKEGDQKQQTDNRKKAEKLASDLKKLKSAKGRLDKIDPPTEQQMLGLLRRFGRFALEGLKFDNKSGPMKDPAILLANVETFRQTNLQIAAIDDPTILKNGLKASSFVLPTAGKPLKNCPWLRSTAEDLVRVATDIRKSEPGFNLKNYPILVLDQSDGDGSDPKKQALWDENDAFLEKLEAEHKDFGLTIKHISMGDINSMIKDSGVEKMFDTTGSGNAGYGGCRNMAFLLGPVLNDMVRNGKRLKNFDAKDLAKAVKKSALDKGAPKLFMGDDTDYVAPGGVCSKLALAASEDHEEEYSLIATKRYGRDTQGVSSAYPNFAANQLASGGLEAFTDYLFSSNKWNTKNTTPGMGCTFGEPRFCLDLPTGAEEKQCEASAFTLDQFGQASHLSGDRQNAPSAFLKSYLAYGNMTETVKALFDVTELPWNAQAKERAKKDKPFENLGEVMGTATDPESQKEMQKSLLTNLVNFRKENGKNGGPLQLDGDQADKVQNYIDQNAGLDAETKDELLAIKDVYAGAKRQAKLMRDFIDNLLKQFGINGSESPEELKRKVAGLVDGDLAAFRTGVAHVRSEMAKTGVKFDASNPMLRDLVLVVDSVGGGFSELCDTLVKAA